MRPLSCVGFVIAALLNPFVAARGAENEPPYGDISALQLAKPEDKIDAPSVPPPPGAIVLFDGTNLEEILLELALASGSSKLYLDAREGRPVD